MWEVTERKGKTWVRREAREANKVALVRPEWTRHLQLPMSRAVSVGHQGPTRPLGREIVGSGTERETVPS